MISFFVYVTSVRDMEQKNFARYHEHHINPLVNHLLIFDHQFLKQKFIIHINSGPFTRVYMAAKGMGAVGHEMAVVKVRLAIQQFLVRWIFHG